MVGEKFFKYPGRMWVRGPPPFFPTAEAGESNMQIVFILRADRERTINT
jgi:hypothetical protein